MQDRAGTFTEYELLEALGIEVEIVTGLIRRKALFRDDLLIVDSSLSPAEREAVACRVLARVQC